MTSGPPYSLIVRLHFIVSFAPIYCSFCVCLISYDFVFYFFFTINSSVFYFTKQEISSRALVHFISSQYSLHLGFASARLFHCLHHLWLSTVLPKAHHSISLHFCLALCLHTSLFCHKSRVTLRVSSHFITSLASHLGSLRFCHFIHTHTHTLSLSLIFPLASCYFGFSISAFAFLPSVTPPASRHTLRHPQLHILLSLASTYLCTPFSQYFSENQGLPKYICPED